MQLKCKIQQNALIQVCYEFLFLFLATFGGNGNQIAFNWMPIWQRQKRNFLPIPL